MATPALRIAIELPGYDSMGPVNLFGCGSYLGTPMRQLGGISAPGTLYY